VVTRGYGEQDMCGHFHDVDGSRGRKRRLLLWCLLGCVSLMGLVVSIKRNSTCIDKAGFERIREEMSEAEVVAILGVPAGDYCTARADQIAIAKARLTLRNRVVGLTRRLPEELQLIKKEWLSDAGFIGIFFDEDMRTVSTYFEPFPGNVLDRMRRWLSF